MLKGPQVNELNPVRKYNNENQYNNTPDEKADNNKYFMDASTPAKGRLPRSMLLLKVRGCKAHKTKKQKF